MSQYKLSVALGAELQPMHSYGVDGLGREIPSVTKIVNPKPYVNGYSTPAMQTGTRIHQRLEEVVRALSKGERLTKMLCGEDIIYNMAMRYRRKIHQAKAKAKAKVETEVSFIAELSNGVESYCYAGTMDLLETSSKNGLTVLDWKTGKPHAWHRLQVAAYMLAVGASHGVIVYPDKLEWVSPISIDEMVHMIHAYHTRAKLVDDKKKLQALKIRAWQKRGVV